MAEVAMSGRHDYIVDADNPASTVPAIDTLLNPEFSFPRAMPSTSNSSHRRPVSMNMNLDRPRTNENSHRRGASALPSFTFNAKDTSGSKGDEAEPGREEETMAEPTTPSRSSHKRNTSELVGGLGVTGAISSSPTRGNALAPPRIQHRSNHSRSRITLSSHDLSAIMSRAPESQPRLSSSLPNTPLDHPATSANHEPSTPDEEVFGPSNEDLQSRPPSRPRVEFSDNVEYIPRPLSTISSGTESSMSTIRGHSVNNSISSVLSTMAPSPPSARARTTSLETTLEDEPRIPPKSSLEISRRIEREGHWLRTGSFGDALHRPFSEPASHVPQSPLTEDPIPAAIRPTRHAKRRSISNNLGFDRRKSEPSMGIHGAEASRLSALSLQEQIANPTPSISNEVVADADRRSSSRKLKDWAVSKLTRRSKDWSRPVSSQSVTNTVTSLSSTSANSDTVVAETDLDAVFSLDADDIPNHTVRVQPTFDVSTHLPGTPSGATKDDDDFGTMLDLDAALGPFKTPQHASQRPRRELHSSRGTKDFVGPGGHYLPNPNHRRTESAPMLTAFDHPRVGTPTQTGMADVFEEEEEDTELEKSRLSRSTSFQSAQDDEAGVGVQIVDSDLSANESTLSVSLDDGLRIQHGDWELERPTTSYGNMASRLSTPILDRHSSVIEETIIEESSPVEPAIVEFHEEPRAQSLTKSSDSSDTPTILASQAEMLALPDGQHSLTPPESYQSSAFSSPDLARRQSSFDTSRVGTSASSIADTRTMSSCTTGDPGHDLRVSVDDVPSLTSSRSTMLSTSTPVTTTMRDVSGVRTPSVGSGFLDPASVASQYRRKRASIQSLSQLVGGSFGPRSIGESDSRPQTAREAMMGDQTPKKKEHRLKKLMFWKSKHRQASASTIT